MSLSIDNNNHKFLNTLPQKLLHDRINTYEQSTFLFGMHAVIEGDGCLMIVIRRPFLCQLTSQVEGKQQATMASLPGKHTVRKILCQLPIDFFILRIPLPWYSSCVQDCMCDTYLHCCLLNDE